MRQTSKMATVGFLTPGVGLLFIFIIIPIVLTAWVSLNHWSMFTSVDKMTFAGLDNYKAIFMDEAFRRALFNTFGYAVFNLIIMVPLSIVLGIFLYKNVLRGNGIVRSLLFLPYVLPTVAVAIVWSYLYSPTHGPLNEILAWFHVAPQDWLGSTDQAMLSLVILNVWQTLGYYVVIILAGLTEIPTSYYEASSIDGANIFQQTFYITLPLMKRSLSFAMVIMTINTLQMFDPVYVLTQGGPVNSTNVVSYHMYDTAFNNGHAGEASSMAFVLFIIVLFFTALQLRLFKSE